MPSERYQSIVVIRGGTQKRSAYARVNDAWRRGLANKGYRVITSDSKAVEPGIDGDFTIHHDYEEPFLQARPQKRGKFIAVRTWDFGPYPRAWAAKVNAEFDQLWVYTRWIRQQAIAGGVEAGRVRVVPLGVDPAVFRAEGPRYPLENPAGLTFLFVGATVYRKGIDILLDAYVRAFSSEDDVLLVIKDHSGDVFYRDISYRDRIKELCRRPGAPAITLIDRYLSEDDLAALYRTCDVAVFPYRAEGFAIPIPQAMACGTPIVAPRFGACLDYVEPECSFLVSARRITLPVGKELAINTLGFEESVEEVDFCEVPVEVLSKQLSDIYSSNYRTRDDWVRRLERRVHEQLSWDAVVDQIIACLHELGDGHSPVGLQ